MRRILFGTYAVVAWLGFAVIIVWSVTFLANISWLTTIDQPATSSTLVAVIVDACLLGLFAVHHSVMARSTPKRWLARIVPKPLIRSTYVLFADALLALVLWQWQSVPTVVWSASPPLREAIWVLYAAGWAIAVAATFMIDHLDLVGIRPALAEDPPEPTFQARWLYRLVRHPLMLGLLIAGWSAPTMTAGHLLFAGLSTGYIGVGVWFEERDLRTELGAPYVAYAARTRAILPLPRRHHGTPQEP